MDITSLLIQLVSGAVGGNVAGAILKKYSLGMLGNSIAGILGGGIGGQVLGGLLGGGMDIGGIIGQVAGGGVGGAILMILVGVVKQMMAK
ncbi:MAG: hypothetical protein OEM91_12670 [Hyphomicrobiales bacterium]|nr:hypothetical protein [Hyphomicrobiales bacterium]